MAKKASKNGKLGPTQKDFKHTWYLQEWMRQAHPPKIQADMVRELGMGRATASAVYNGQQYTQTLIDALAPWLNVEPYELLLHPDVAFAIRRLRAEGLRLAKDVESAERAVEARRRA